MGAFCCCFQDPEKFEDNIDNSNKCTNFISRFVALFRENETPCSSGEACLSSREAGTEFEESEECPVCLEEYTVENPEITMECSHSYHLACIYEWIERCNLMERCNFCPICEKVIQFKES